MYTNKVWKHLSLNLLVLTLTFFVSMTVVPEFNQVFAGTGRHIIIDDGNLDSAGGKFTMKAHGDEYYTHETHSGDWMVKDIDGTKLRLADAWVKYYFKVPAYMYDNKLITKFTVKVQYDRVDKGDCGGGSENCPPKLYCYDRQHDDWDHWFDFSATGDGNYKWAEHKDDPNIYPSDPSYHIEDSGGEKYQIHIKIDTPDGDGSAPGDDDAEIDIDQVYVILYFDEDKPGKVIKSGDLNEADKTYTMKAYGKDVWRVMPGEEAKVLSGDAFRIKEGWMQYAFEVPHDMLDHRLINKLRVKVKYDRVDWASSDAGKAGDAWPPKFYVYSFDEKKFNKWKDFPEAGDGNYKWVENHTYNIYKGTNDDHQYVGFEGGNKYRIYVKIYAPDGAGWRNDNDAIIDIDEVHVVLELNHPHVPELTHISPDKIDDKVNVPVDSTRDVTFSVEAENVEAQYVKGVREYQWQEQLANDPAPSPVETFDDKTTDSKKNYAFGDSGQYKLYCKTIYEEGDPMISKLLTTPIRAWYRPTVNDTPPNPDNVSWYDGKYVGVVGDDVDLQASGETQNSDGSEKIDKYVWLDDQGDKFVEHNHGQIATHQWDAQNLNGRIKCKAVTNYEIESSEQTFELKIYPTLEIDHYGAYNGRPKKPVTLDGSINRDGYPGATFEYEWEIEKVDAGGNSQFVMTGKKDTPKIERTWDEEGDRKVTLMVTVTTQEGLTIEDSAETVVKLESGVPTSLPGGPYSGGIDGGNFSPIQFEGNHPDFVEADDIGQIDNWLWDFGVTIEAQGEIRGDATEEDDFIQLTPNEDSSHGAFEYSDLSPGDSFQITGEFWTGGGDGADAFFVYFWANGTPAGEGTPKGQYSIAYDEYTDEIQLIYDGSYLVKVDQNNIDNSKWRSFRVQFLQGLLKIYLDGELKIEYDDSKNYENRMSNPLFGVGARTGGLNNFHRVKNINWKKLLGTDDIWNPTQAFSKAGKYEASLCVQSEYGKWSFIKSTDISVIDGKIEGYVKAADLRTPVEDVRLTLSSSHVDPKVLQGVANEDSSLNTGDDGESIWTLTDAEGFYRFEHIPLGSYRVVASKTEGDNEHEFEKTVKLTELTLDAPKQLGLDFVDISVYPISGRIVYSIKRDGEYVLVKDVVVKAQPVASTSDIESLPSKKSVNATGTNYSLPLFAGKYLFKAVRDGHNVRIDEDCAYYDKDTQLVTIKKAVSDVDFIDHTERTITVYIEDSGGYKIKTNSDGNPIEVEVNGDNGFAENNGQIDENEDVTYFEATVPPGEYTISLPNVPDAIVRGGESDGEDKAEVNLTSSDGEVTMVVPVKIELELSESPKLFDVDEDFLEQFGLTEDDNPSGYMFYYSPEPRTHTYTITATANGNPVDDYILYVEDEISMLTEDPPEEQEFDVEGTDDDGDPNGQGEYPVEGGLPKQNRDVDPPEAAPKKITFRVEKDGYTESDTIEDLVTVLGDVSVGTAQKIVSVPIVNYTVLHDPPGDGSYSYLDDSMTFKGIVSDMTIEIEDRKIPVYPSPWRDERSVEGFEFKKSPGSDTKSNDLKDKGLLGYKDSRGTEQFTWMAVVEAARGGAVSGLMGPFAYLVQIANMGASYGIMKGVGIQYEVSPNRHLETPSGDELTDLVGPGKGDIYYGEGWTLGLQDKYRLGIEFVDEQWQLKTIGIATYDILERTNQYVYTIRDIKNIISDLQASIDDLEAKEQSEGLTDNEKQEKKKLENAKKTWDDLLDKNLAYKWNQNLNSDDPDSFDDFKDGKGLSDDSETLIFSAGPSFDYSRTITEQSVFSISMEAGPSTSGELGTALKAETGFRWMGSGITVLFNAGGTASIDTGTSLSREWETGKGTEQTVGFVLNDDDIGDNIITRVYTDPRWGTPIFFQDPGSITSSPWETGTNKGVDLTLELVDDPDNNLFDYHDGAHYLVKINYIGERVLENATVDFVIYDYPYLNQDNLTALFNGDRNPYVTAHTEKEASIIVEVSLYPPKIDQDNSFEKEYSVGIEVDSVEDPAQINRILTLKPKFADLRAPRAVITAPYNGERISPEVFKDDKKFKIEAYSDNQDLAKIQIEIRSKRTDGVWEPWRTLSGMVWEDGGTNENVTVVTHSDRDPVRREFTFDWSGDDIANLGVGEYALRAVAQDKATRLQTDGSQADNPNIDLDAPVAAFQVDGSKPTVLTTTPDYQARESERVYRGELSVLFNDDMRADDFTDRTFYVTDLLNNSEKIAGIVSYSPALRKTIFVSQVPFQPNGFFRVEIKTDVDTDDDGEIDEKGVHDLAGNPLDNAFMFTFRTNDTPFEETWSITLSADDGVSIDANNIAAVAYGALDGEDEKDARAVPKIASQFELSFLDRAQVKFDRDTRPADGRLGHHWFFAISNPDGDVTIEYQPSKKLAKSPDLRQYKVVRLVEFDADGNVSNTIDLHPEDAEFNPTTGKYDPLVAYTYTPEGGETVRHFRLDVQKASFVATAFEKGTTDWRFFSAPITPERADPFVNLGDDIEPFQMYKYDTKISGYKIYPLDLGEVGLQTGHGYFTRLSEDVEVDVGGSSNNDNIELELVDVGWHAIGNPFVKAVDVEKLQVKQGETTELFADAVTAGWIEGTLYRWNVDPDGSDAYEAVDNSGQLASWDGYWLKTKSADLTLTIPAPAGLGGYTAPLPPSFDPPMAPLNVVDLAIHNERVLKKDEFNLRLELTSDFSSDLSTILGTRSSAKAGLDAYDGSEPPTLEGTVSAYFDHKDWQDEPGLYNTDYQPPLEIGEERRWKLVVYTNKPKAKMQLSWEKAIEQIPDDVMLYFRNQQSAILGLSAKRIETTNQQSVWQDMRQVRFVELDTQKFITKETFEIRAERFEMPPLEDFSVIAGEKKVTIKWSTNDNPFITGYGILRFAPDDSSVVQDDRTVTANYKLEPNASQFTDTAVEEEATYTYQLVVHYKTSAEIKSELFTVTVLAVIEKTVLLQCYPNPFNPETWIPYELKRETGVTIEIYNVSGQIVRTLNLDVQPRGRYISKEKAAYWDGCNEFGEHAASGVYFYVLKVDDFVSTKKMVILK